MPVYAGWCLGWEFTGDQLPGRFRAEVLEILLNTNKEIRNGLKK